MLHEFLTGSWVSLRVLSLRDSLCSYFHGCFTQGRGKSIIFNQSGDIHLLDVDQFRCVEDKFVGHKFNEIKITLYIKRKYETIQLCPNEYICVEIRFRFVSFRNLLHEFESYEIGTYNCCQSILNSYFQNRKYFGCNTA